MTAFLEVLALLAAAGVGFSVGRLGREERSFQAGYERGQLARQEARATAWTKTHREKRDA